MLTILSSQTKSLSVPNHGFGSNGFTTDLVVNQAEEVEQDLINTALIATPGEEASVSDWLWPLLAARSQESRWLFWIGPPEWPTSELFRTHGIDPSRVRLVHLTANSDSLTVVERALRAGTCSAVLAWPATIEQAQLSRIRQAASENKALAILMPSQTVLSLAA
ncbi:MAG: SulA-like leucine-rich domain-containing protein [Candidatus Competibacteraceae bacterium]|jgi:cell division inhibitor SulA|nr:SulA-like leucine-rich domain-containing protein [Candidatus Competibacteraceae bacterium]